MSSRRSNACPALDPTTKSTRRVALLLQGWSGWHCQLIRGVQSFAHTRPNWRLHIDGGLPGTSRMETGGIQWDGVITSAIRDDRLLRKLSQDPSVHVIGLSSTQSVDLDIPIVRVDDTALAATAGEHFLASGYRQLAYLGPSGWGRIDARGDAARSFAAERNLPFHAFVTRRPRTSNLNANFPMGEVVNWVRKLPRPVGLYVWHMPAAQHAVEACRRAGLRVPADVAVVSADDDPVIAEASEPSITALALPAERVAYRASEVLDGLMNGTPRPDGPVLVAPSRIIHVRESSDAMSLPDRDVYLAVQYVRENAHVALKVEQIARVIGTSRTRLDEMFVRVRGHTPHEELIRAHLTRATQLLVETPWPIRRVATESGFGTARTMHRVFLERQGRTPAAYRDMFGVRGAAD